MISFSTSRLWIVIRECSLKLHYRSRFDQGAGWLEAIRHLLSNPEFEGQHLEAHSQLYQRFLQQSKAHRAELTELYALKIILQIADCKMQKTGIPQKLRITFL